MERLMILLTDAVYDYGGDVSSGREVGINTSVKLSVQYFLVLILKKNIWIMFLNVYVL